LGNHLVDHLRCRLYSEAVVNPDDYYFRIPDLSVTCEPVTADDLLLREPILIIEIRSPSNTADTRAAVVCYMSIPSVQEILVLHSMEIKAELLRREEDAPWTRLTLLPDDDVTLASIGFTARLPRSTAPQADPSALNQPRFRAFMSITSS
jgi:Uma2 family endonuclease